jgi:hypothetical protein
MKSDSLGAKKRMINAMWSVLLSIFTVAASPQGELISSAVQQNGNTAQAKAERVLKQAQEVTRIDLKNAEIKGLIVSAKGDGTFTLPERALKARPQFRNKKFQETFDEELAISLPDKIRYKINADHTFNQEISEWIVNGNRSSQKTDVLVDGKPINAIFSSANPKSEQEQIAQRKNSAFLTAFPITLDYSLYSPTEFRYIGVAEVKDVKTDVIDTTLSNGSTYRFFFDQQTHLLLLMIETRTDKETNKEVQRKYFFSDYRREEGLLVAHKIVTEENGEVIQETQIKRLQVNPTFKPDYFAVKGK